MNITTGKVEYAGPITRKRSKEQDNEADFQKAKRLRAFLTVIMNLEPDQEFFTKQQNDDYAFILEVIITNAMARDIPIPKMYEEAISNPTYGEQWQTAINRKVEELEKNKI
ncbi:hypothetical protein EYC80_009194 [Monilinia laxa]|uniref:Uncharacterized protein n=1 Tax=Monilinia laxa TaxID=61186 RepID=A0A5N6JX42_MONLA|nr:hypothetical protein EYC80_009194 [Monilinia laxa]